MWWVGLTGCAYSAEQACIVGLENFEDVVVDVFARLFIVCCSPGEVCKFYCESFQCFRDFVHNFNCCRNDFGADSIGWDGRDAVVVVSAGWCDGRRAVEGFDC